MVVQVVVVLVSNPSSIISSRTKVYVSIVYSQVPTTNRMAGSLKEYANRVCTLEFEFGA